MGERPDEHLMRIADADLSEGNLRLARFREIPGSSYLYADLASPSEYIGSGSSGGLGVAHNLLFFDTATKKARWLLPDNHSTIPSVAVLLDPPGCGYDYGHDCDDGERKTRRVALAMLVEVQQPTGTPSGSEARPRSLALASIDGRDLTTIADNVDGLLGYHQTDKSSVLVFYVAEGAARVIELDPTARKVHSNTLLSTDEQRAAQPAAAAVRGRVYSDAGNSK